MDTCKKNSYSIKLLNANIVYFPFLIKTFFKI